MSKKILSTRNYRLFKYNTGDNRLLDIEQHKGLLESMKEYGFLESFPIVVYRNGDEHLIVKDGQHRLNFAEKLGLPVYYVEDTTNFDVAKVNKATKIWVPKDYAQKFAAGGVKSYEEGLEFAERHKLPVGTAFSLLGGYTGFAHIKQQFLNGAFKIKDKEWAEAVAGIYKGLAVLSKSIRGSRLLEACMAACRVPEFDAKRLLRNVERCREKLISYSTRDAYLQMLEDIYNFHHSKLFGLKVAATMAMRERNASVKSQATKAAKSAK